MVATLRRVWEATPPNAVFDAAVAGDTTVILRGVHEAYGLWARDGSLRWTFPTSKGRWMDWVLRTPAGPVLHSQVDGRWRVSALDFDGSPRWTIASAARTTMGAVACATRGSSMCRSRRVLQRSSGVASRRSSRGTRASPS